MTKNKRPAVAATTAGAVNGSNQPPPFTNKRQTKQVHLRTQLAHLRARYDAGAVAPAVYAVIRQLETDIAWAEEQTS